MTTNRCQFCQFQNYPECGHLNGTLTSNTSTQLATFAEHVRLTLGGLMRSCDRMTDLDGLTETELALLETLQAALSAARTASRF